MLYVQYVLAVVQSVVLYGCETWTLDEAKLNALRGFHNRLTRSSAHKRGIRDPRTGMWTYPPIADAQQIAGMIFSMEHYLNARQRLFVDQPSECAAYRRSLQGGHTTT